jgi:hypothetical protein
MSTNRNEGARKEFFVGEVIAESFKLVSGLKSPILWGYGFLSMIISIIVITIVSSYIPPLNTTMILVPATESVPAHMALSGIGTFNPYFYFVVAINSFFVWYFFCTGVMLGVKKSIGLPTRFWSTFSECWNVKVNLFYLFVVWIILFGINVVTTNQIIPNLTSNTGLKAILHIFTVIVIVYVKLPIIIFAVPLVVIKRYDAMRALNSSYQMMNVYGIKIMMCFFAITIITMLGSIPLGLGLIWTIPMYFAMLGIFFRDAYHLKAKPASPVISGNPVTDPEP